MLHTKLVCSLRRVRTCRRRLPAVRASTTFVRRPGSCLVTDHQLAVSRFQNICWRGNSGCVRPDGIAVVEEGNCIRYSPRSRTSTSSTGLNDRVQLIYKLTTQAKRLTYGIIYGIGHEALAQQLGIIPQEADTLKRSFLASFPSVQR